MADKNFLAIDLGAESGRGVLASFDGERVALRELGRFPTGQGDDDLGPDNVRRWDFPRILSEIEGLLSKAQLEAGSLDGVAVDSWGVDFGLLDDNGNLLAHPVCYRDLSHAEAMKDLLTEITKEELWDATGIPCISFNSINQLRAIQKREPELLEKAGHLLLMPDLIHNRLTGNTSFGVEVSNGSTTQMMNPGGAGWNTALLDRLGLPSHFLGPIVKAGDKLGVTAKGVPVYACGTHDTASALAAVPAGSGENWAFLSSGTWSLLGVELAEPALSRQALEFGYSNEGAVVKKIQLLKNIMGLWLVQESRRSIKKTTGREYSYPELVTLAEAAPEGGALIDATLERFMAPSDMVEEIRAMCRETGQPAPREVGEIIRCCLESLALAYRRVLAGQERLLGRQFDTLHIIGGGSNNLLLNQWTADACGIRVLAGPGEATALGNALCQLVGSGAIANWTQAREVSGRSFSGTTFIPNPEAAMRWADREGQAVGLWVKSDQK